MSKSAGVFVAKTSDSFKAQGVTISMKRGSLRQIITLPTFKGSSVVTALAGVLPALDKLTSYSIRSATMPIIINRYNDAADDRTFPSDAPGIGRISISGNAKDGNLSSSQRFIWQGKLKEVLVDPTASASITRNLDKVLIYALGSYFGPPDDTWVPEASLFISNGPPAGPSGYTNPGFLFDEPFDASHEDINPLPPSYIRFRIGDRSYFLNVPRMEWGTGGYNFAIPEVDDTTHPGRPAPANNLTALGEICRLLQPLMAAQVVSAGITLCSNTNNVIPDDVVGREAVKSITYRVTNSADPTQQENFKIRIPGYSNWGNLDDATLQTQYTTIGNYFKSVFNSDSSDTVEVLF
jgi:hypothetical protein